MGGSIEAEPVAAFRARLAALPRTKNGTENFESAELALLSDSDCRRFLTARDQKVEQAADMARGAMEWRMKFGIDNIGPGDIPNALPQVCKTPNDAVW